MLETWLLESKVRLPVLVILETWLRESGVLRLRNVVLISSAKLFFVANYHTSFFNADNSLIVYRTSILACHA